MKTLAVIPVRYESTRFPGKPLIEVCGRPMIRWVYEAARAAGLVHEVLFATDDERIREAASAFGAPCVMTGDAPRNGSERVAEALRGREADLVVNLQGDEPLMTGEVIDAAIRALRDDPAASLSTVAVRFPEGESLDDANAVKVVLDGASRALYFSRLPIPYLRHPGATHLLHVGIYVFRRAFLEEYAQLPPSPLERSEGLEQLRALEAGKAIRVVVVDDRLFGIDVPEDVPRVERALEARRHKGGARP